MVAQSCSLHAISFLHVTIMPLIYANMQLNYINIQHYYVDMQRNYVNIYFNMLNNYVHMHHSLICMFRQKHVEINKSHVTIIKLHANITYLVCRAQRQKLIQFPIYALLNIQVQTNRYCIAIFSLKNQFLYPYILWDLFLAEMSTYH